MEAKRFHIDDLLEPSEAFHVAMKPLARRFPRFAHDHDFFEVFWVETGQAEHWINGTVQSLRQGDMICIRPTDTHAFKADEATGCKIVNLAFRAETAAHLASRYAAEFAGRLFDTPDPTPSPWRLSGTQLSTLLQAASRLRTQVRSLARIEQFLLLLAGELIDIGVQPEAPGPRWFVNACRTVREKEYFRRGAAGLTDAAGRSHEHVCRTCRGVLGLTPSAYVNQVRISHAAELLRSTELSIREISEDCGIENISHFYRLFRDQTGSTPRLFRKRTQADPFEAR